MRKILLILIALLINDQLKAQSYSQEHYYYNASGQKISGLIEFNPSRDYIHFKQNENDKAQKIKIENINSIVVGFGGYTGRDSFVVLTMDNKAKKRYFAKPYLATPVTKFYSKFIEGSYGGGATLSTLSNVPNSGNNGVHSITRVSSSPATSFGIRLYMYSDGNTTYRLTKRNYIEVLSKAFADVPNLVKRIQNKEFKFEKVSSLFYEYRTQTSYKGTNTLLQ